MRISLALLLLLTTFAARGAEVRVFAAASLTEALEEIAKTYEKKSGDRIVFNFGASSLLARQIEHGAPADLFLSADEAKMNVLQLQQLIEPRTRVSLLSNTLVVVVPSDANGVKSPRDLANVTRIALAEPSSVPAGIYARTYLQNEGLWEAVAPKVVPTDNVRAALAAVDAGNVDAAIVYKTDAKIARRARIAYEIPRDAGPKISYPFAVVTNGEQRVAARRFLDYLRSADARAVFAKHGFLL